MKNKQYHLKLDESEYNVLKDNDLLNNSDLNSLFLIGYSKLQNQNFLKDNSITYEIKTHNYNLEKIIHDIFDII